jgi:hypothetical protein
MENKFEKVIYSKEETPSEYQENGHYLIDGVDYMSLWAYKGNFEKNIFTDKNSETAGILKKRYLFEISKPDLGKMNQVLIFRLENLEKHYNKTL